MKNKIFWQILSGSFIMMLLIGSIIFTSVQLQFNDHVETTTALQAEVLIQKLNNTDDQVSALQSFVVDSMRVVLLTQDDVSIYDNHEFIDTSEIIPLSSYAQEYTSDGIDIQMYSSIHEITFYCAVTLDNGNTLFVSQTVSGSLQSFYNYIIILLFVLLLIIIGCGFAAGQITKKVVATINDIDVQNPIQNAVFDELSPLLLKIDAQNRKINRQMLDISNKKHELSDIMSNIHESIVILNKQGVVLSINDAALNMFAKNKDECIGKFLLSVNRDAVFIDILERLKSYDQFQTDFSTNGKIYRVAVSSASNSGSILIFLDVTERRAAQKMRVEFSANVSHELKTPLQTISGYAELLSSGMVAEDKQLEFCSYIYKESQRMTALIQDIINLSYLDEQSNFMKKVDIDVYEIAMQVKSDLKVKAENCEIDIIVTGSSSVISGISRLIHECIFNLADNAINYNKKNGSVIIDVQDSELFTTLSVQDTGIGIALCEQDRIFERFYRVDKSRSRTTGGTGLGLSIVKHVATLHNAKVDIKSMVNVGTTITITLPKKTKEI